MATLTELAFVTAARVGVPGVSGGFETDEPGEDGHLVGEVFDELGGSGIGAADTFDDVRQRGGRHGGGHQHDQQTGRIHLGRKSARLLQRTKLVQARARRTT
jgi:hypothetical protein